MVAILQFKALAMAFVVRTFYERMNDNLIMHFNNKTTQMRTRIYQYSLNAINLYNHRGIIEFIKVCKAVVRTGPFCLSLLRLPQDLAAVLLFCVYSCKNAKK